MARAGQAFDRAIAALQALRSAPDPSNAREQLGRALRDRNSYIVARAAAIAAELHLDDLAPAMLSAFERFMLDAAKTDPQCLAKTAIVQAVRSLGHRDPQVYVRGIAHVQLEPAWGGRADTAAALRGACALALTDTQIPDLEILSHLADVLADPDALVRVEAARAIEQLNREEGAVLLRLKALLGDADAGVQGQCFASYLSLAPQGAVSFISRFLRSPSEDVQLEAASALAQCRDSRAIEVLREYWTDPRLAQDVRRALVINLGASALQEAADWLVNLVARESVDLATTAMTALANGRYRNDVRARVAAIVVEKDSSRLTATFDAEFGPT